MNKVGQIGEDLVCAHYQKLGFEILDRNFIFPHGKQVGELDLVVRKNNEIAFVEVKTRRNNKFGDPYEAVDFYKQRKLVKMVKLYLKLHPKFSDFDYHIDVAAVDIDNIGEPVIILANAIEDYD
jgi:putative endonuclease